MFVSLLFAFLSLFSPVIGAFRSISRARCNRPTSQQSSVVVVDPEVEAFNEGLILETAPRSPWPVPSTQALRDDGVVYVLNTVSASTATKLRVHCESTLVENLASVASGAAFFSDLFGTVRARTARYDLKLALEPTAVADALAEALEVLGPLLREALKCEPYLASLVR